MIFSPNFLSDRASFNEVILGRFLDSLKMGLVARGTSHVIRALEISEGEKC
jgi:hypothetical protein